jgi:hypothetical protein
MHAYRPRVCPPLPQEMTRPRPAYIALFHCALPQKQNPRRNPACKTVCKMMQNFNVYSVRLLCKSKTFILCKISIQESTICKPAWIKACMQWHTRGICHLQFPGIRKVEHSREKQVHVDVVEPFQRSQVSMEAHLCACTYVTVSASLYDLKYVFACLLDDILQACCSDATLVYGPANCHRCMYMFITGMHACMHMRGAHAHMYPWDFQPLAQNHL